MQVVFKKEAMKVFYFLLMADGDVTNDELITFDEIGINLDQEHFRSYRDELISSCIGYSAVIDQEDDMYDILQENVDKALSARTNIIDDGIPPRLLLWDLIVLAYSNRDYDASENKMVRHVARVLDIDKSIFMEMKQIAETSVAVRKELEWVQTQDRPYSEIRPIVEELENRMAVLRECAENLVTDEIVVPDPEEKSNAFTKAIEAVNEKVSPTLEVAKEKTGKAFETAKETVGEGVKKGAKGFLSGLTKGAKFVTRKSMSALDNIEQKIEKKNKNDDCEQNADM